MLVLFNWLSTMRKARATSKYSTEDMSSYHAHSSQPYSNYSLVDADSNTYLDVYVDITPNACYIGSFVCKPYLLRNCPQICSDRLNRPWVQPPLPHRSSSVARNDLRARQSPRHRQLPLHHLALYPPIRAPPRRSIWSQPSIYSPIRLRGQRTSLQSRFHVLLSTPTWRRCGVDQARNYLSNEESKSWIARLGNLELHELVSWQRVRGIVGDEEQGDT